MNIIDWKGAEKYYDSFKHVCDMGEKLISFHYAPAPGSEVNLGIPYM